MTDSDVVTRTIERNRVRNQIVNCTACGLHLGCRGPVPFRGQAPSRVLFLGEAPGGMEDAIGRPFVGPAGEQLEVLLRDTGLGKSNDHAVINAVCCRPPMNATPEMRYVIACQHNLRAQVAFIDPEWVVTLGAVPLKAIGITGTSIGNCHGAPFKIEAGPAIGRMCLPTYHPAAALRDPKLVKVMKTDLGILQQILSGRLEWTVLGRRMGKSGKLWPL